MSFAHDSTLDQLWPNRLENRIDVTNALAVLVVTALVYLAYHVSGFASNYTNISTYRRLDLFRSQGASFLAKLSSG